ncbi:hypothetical protein Y1Q_0000025 [Alligator mississippiensis]|uniref:DDE Tnp4 domain-containing protein n=1 Tax=Alligator mississippiensis TaxID=8496 RepID=A0A151NUS6_ALLMI|nr:hypothetical protein Y1Q_0000025 [Alligator mississippiensis]
MLGHAVLWIHDPLEVVGGFYSLGFPQCIRALDGTHIPVTCPPRSDHLYFSQWGFHLVVVQAVVDRWGTFTNVSADWIGSTHNAHIFRNSTLQLGEVMVPSLLIRDPTYLLLPWSMQSYISQLDPCQAYCNRCLVWACALVECAFVCLKGLWRMLTSLLKVTEANVSQVIIAACVLPNICDAQREVFYEMWTEEAQWECQLALLTPGVPVAVAASATAPPHPLPPPTEALGELNTHQ